jgi:hypothetical protein
MTAGQCLRSNITAGTMITITTVASRPMPMGDSSPAGRADPGSRGICAAALSTDTASRDEAGTQPCGEKSTMLFQNVR